MNIVLTGASGFLGWHTRCRLHALSDHEVSAVTRDNWGTLPTAAAQADAIIHVAGINRADDRELVEGNIQLARDVAYAARSAKKPPLVVFAGTIQAGNNTPYGDGKAAARDELRRTAEEIGSTFVDVRFCNLFGERARPNYNSFLATFIEKRITGDEPTIQDRPINLLHGQKAAQVLMDALDATNSSTVSPTGHETTVQQVWDKLTEFDQLYPKTGDIPALDNDFDIDLFNSYRAALFPDRYPIALDPKADNRGRLVETVRAHGSQGLSFISTTKPGITRGDHYHLRKIERFAVLVGNARISLRRMFTNDVVSFDVDGDRPTAIDMPTMWTHNITNTGDTEVVTQFWANELLDPDNPDTYWVKVDSQECIE